jgi:two-component system KDP operon response regulator KdpE
VSAREKERDKVEALDAGADDYLTKPFGTAELLARIRVALRHSLKTMGVDDGLFGVGELRVDLVRRQVFVQESEVHLTPIEYKLLTILIQNAGKVVTGRQLLKLVWGPAYMNESHYIRVYMGQLRHKLEVDPTRPRYLITEPGVGYRLKVE